MAWSTAIKEPGDYTKEWATNGGGAGSWLKLTWSSPVTLATIVLFDRPNLNDQITSATLTFSNGTQIPVGALPNDGSALTVNVPQYHHHQPHPDRELRQRHHPERGPGRDPGISPRRRLTSVGLSAGRPSPPRAGMGGRVPLDACVPISTVFSMALVAIAVMVMVKLTAGASREGHVVSKSAGGRSSESGTPGAHHRPEPPSAL